MMRSRNGCGARASGSPGLHNCSNTAARFVIRLKYELAIVRHAIGRVGQAIGDGRPLRRAGGSMRVLIATDAWHPQVNGVVRTLTSLQRSALALGADIRFLTPEGFPSMELPTYPGLRVAWPKRR